MTPVLGQRVKANIHSEKKREKILLNPLLELYQDMLLKVPTDERRSLYFDFEQAVIFDFWVKRAQELKMLTDEQLRRSLTLEE